MFTPKHKLILVLFALTLGGCKFGNYSQDPTLISVEGVKKIETFTAQVNQFKTYVFYEDDTFNQNLNAPTTAVPLSLLNTFTNPFQLFIMADPSLPNYFASMYATPSNPGTVYPAPTDAAGNFTLSGEQVAAYRFGPDPSCFVGIYISEGGNLDRTQHGNVVFPDGSHYSTTGTLSLVFIYEQIFFGTCGPYLQRLADCYQNGSGCTSQELSDAQLFQLYSTQTGVIDPAKVSSIKELAYKTYFQ